MKLTEIKGVGPRTYHFLVDRGLFNKKDIINFFPVSYNEYKLTNFSLTEYMNLPCTYLGNIIERKINSKNIIVFDIISNEYTYKVTCFNMPFLKHILKEGEELVIVGKYDEEYRSIVASKVFKRKDYKEGVFPVYNIDGVPDSLFNKIVNECLKDNIKSDSFIPDYYLIKNDLYTQDELYHAIHFPSDMISVFKAKKTLKYLEMFPFALEMLYKKEKTKNNLGSSKNYDINKVKELIKSIPYELTDDQKKATNEIFIDLKKKTQMNRLLQGDVGCGKTVVALLSSFAVITSSYQVAIMAPTEVLANQHFNYFKKMLEPFNVNVELLTSSITNQKRKEILEGLSNGRINLIIGTHALITESVEYYNLGLVITDEQHRFGVVQRRKLKEKGYNPDILYMTATPIPRTLALSFFTDLEISSIKELPKGRKKVITKIYTYNDYVKLLEFVHKEVKEGHQAYFISPLIEENPDLDMSNVLKVKADLETVFRNKDIKIGLLHGKLKVDEREEVLSKFYNNEIQILVSTTVVEVGVNVPNATCMVILDANQFGLSQIHQLRGRVGRGEDEAFCFLVTNKGETARLKVLERETDGFKISEEDLKDRGPGDFLGTNQAGKIKFKYSNIIDDYKFIKEVFEEVKEVFNKDSKYHYLVSLIKNNIDSNQFD